MIKQPWGVSFPDDEEVGYIDETKEDALDEFAVGRDDGTYQVFIARGRRILPVSCFPSVEDLIEQVEDKLRSEVFFDDNIYTAKPGADKAFSDMLEDFFERYIEEREYYVFDIDKKLATVTVKDNKVICCTTQQPTGG